MSKEKGKELKINKVLASFGGVCSILAIAIIVLPSLSKTKIETLANSSKQMEHNYTTTTESNTWDISKNGDGSVIATLDGNGLLTIAGSGEMISFESTSLPWYFAIKQIKNVKIENGIANIGSYAFSYCRSLINIEIPESITRIEDRAFYGCRSVTSIEIPKSVTIIGFRAFEACTGLTSIEIPSSVTSIGGYAFRGCESVTSIEIPESVTSVGYGAFEDCTSLTSIEFPSSVTKLDDRTLANCTSLRNIKIPESVKYISPNAFSYCISLTNIEVDENNEKFCDENGVLYTKDKKEIIKYPAGKMETTITILDDVTSIGNVAFQACRSLTRIEIPSSITSISSSAFSSCKSLTNIEVDGNNEKYCDENGVLYTKDKKEIIRYPEGKVETTYTIINGVTSIGDSAFRYCESLTSIEIPESVTSIGSYAFANCKSLKSIKIPSSVTSIGTEGFLNCSEIRIICQSGSTAEAYAKENSKKYQTDDIGPEIESTPATNTNPSKKIEVKINVTDEVAGVNEQSIKYLWSEESKNITKDQITEELTNGETLQLKDVTGTYYLWIYAKDNVGNETIEKKGPFKLDNIAPIANINYSTTNVTNQNVTVTITGNEELQGITGWTKSANGEELTKEYTSNTVVEGENITIKDLAGNESKVNVKVLNIDKERPTINISYSTTTATNQNVIVTITGNEELQGITGWTKSANGQELTKECTSNTVVEGENITVKDLAGNESKVNVKVLNIDKELPTIEINTEITSTTISVTAVATDSNSGINENSNRYYIKEENGTYVEGIAAGNTHTFTNLTTNKKYDIKVEVTDNAGNKASKEVQVTTKKSNKVTSTEYKINEEKLMIKEIQPKTTVGEIKDKIQGEMEFKIINAKGEIVSNTSKVATGYKIKLEDNKEYTLVVTGDCNGDGEADIKDILAINKHRLNRGNLVDEYLIAGDVNKDGTVDIKDILQINKFRLGKITEI